MRRGDELLSGETRRIATSTSTASGFFPALPMRSSGWRPEQQRSFQLTLPEDFSREELRGVTVDVDVTVSAVRERILPRSTTPSRARRRARHHARGAARTTASASRRSTAERDRETLEASALEALRDHVVVELPELDGGTGDRPSGHRPRGSPAADGHAAGPLPRVHRHDRREAPRRAPRGRCAAPCASSSRLTRWPRQRGSRWTRRRWCARSSGWPQGRKLDRPAAPPPAPGRPRRPGAAGGRRASDRDRSRGGLSGAPGRVTSKRPAACTLPSPCGGALSFVLIPPAGPMGAGPSSRPMSCLRRARGPVRTTPRSAADDLRATALLAAHVHADGPPGGGAVAAAAVLQRLTGPGDPRRFQAWLLQGLYHLLAGAEASAVPSAALRWSAPTRYARAASCALPPPVPTRSSHAALAPRWGGSAPTVAACRRSLPAADESQGSSL